MQNNIEATRGRIVKIINRGDVQAD